jgi:hypothetical protein
VEKRYSRGAASMKLDVNRACRARGRILKKPYLLGF